MKSVLFLLMLISTITVGQRHFVSLGADVAVPTDKSKDFANTGYGGSFRFEYKVIDHLAVIGSWHYLSFTKKNYTSPTPPITSLSFKTVMFPVQAGGKFYFFRTGKFQKGLFVSAELGVTILIFRVLYNGAGNSATESDFSYAPGFGYQFKNFEFGYQKQFITSSGRSVNYSGFRLGYIFRK